MEQAEADDSWNEVEEELSNLWRALEECYINEFLQLIQSHAGTDIVAEILVAELIEAENQPNAERNSVSFDPKRPFRCEICTSSFKSRKTLNQHNGDKHEPPKFPCPVSDCGCGFSRPAKLRHHCLRVHKVFVCTTCREVFNSHDERSDHSCRVLQPRRESPQWPPNDSLSFSLSPPSPGLRPPSSPSLTDTEDLSEISSSVISDSDSPCEFRGALGLPLLQGRNPCAAVAAISFVYSLIYGPVALHSKIDEIVKVGQVYYRCCVARSSSNENLLPEEVSGYVMLKNNTSYQIRLDEGARATMRQKFERGFFDSHSLWESLCSFWNSDSDYDYGILTLNSQSIAMIRDDEFLYLFDPYSRGDRDGNDFPARLLEYRVGDHPNYDLTLEIHEYLKDTLLWEVRSDRAEYYPFTITLYNVFKDENVRMRVY